MDICEKQNGTKQCMDGVSHTEWCNTKVDVISGAHAAETQLNPESIPKDKMKICGKNVK
jgi:hypothetical protein